MASQREVVSSDGTRIFVTDDGDGPPVVLLHGLACVGSMWDQVNAELRDRYRIITADLRGHGRSVPVVGGASLQQQADDLTAIIKTLDLRQVVLVGHSAGGYAALAFATLRPELARERVRGIMTIGTATSLDHFRERFILWFAVTRLFYAAIGFGPLGRLLVRTGAFGRRPEPSLVEQTRLMAVACSRDTKREWVNETSGTSLASDLARIGIPLTLATGSKDSTVTAARLRSAAAAIAAHAVIIPNVGHMAPLEAPDAVARLIDEIARQPG